MSSAKANLGRHLCVGIPGPALTTETRQLLQQVQPGGIILFTRNINSADQLRALTAELHALPGRPFVAVDCENYRVNRLRDVGGELPRIAEVKRAGQATPFGRQLGRTLREHGIDLDFAPVLDLETFDDKTDNALRERCWGATADEVVRWGGEFIDGLSGEGVIPCGKHFPGLGASRQDSHDLLPTIRRSREKLLAEDVVPFARLQSRLPALMVSHAEYTAFEKKPASLSRIIIGELLRRQLGYTGVVFTDDMEMGAINQWGGFTEAVVEALVAGADMLLVCHTAARIDLAHEALRKAAESGRLTPERLNESAARLSKLW